MNRLRKHWLALLGGGLLLALSISSAFGAKPADAPANQPNSGGELSNSAVDSVVDNDADEADEADEAEDVDDGDDEADEDD